MTTTDLGHLPLDILTTVHRGAIRLNLDRSVLIKAIPVDAYVRLAKEELYGPQIWSDLVILNDLRSPHPLQCWLEAARGLSAGSIDEDAFVDALRLLGAASTATQFRGSLESYSVSPTSNPNTQVDARIARVQVVAHASDARIVARFRSHIVPLERRSLVTIDDPGAVLPGSILRPRLFVPADVEVAVVFLSHDLLASLDHDDQLEELVRRSRDGKLRVVPIVARPCDWRSSAMGKLQVLPRSERPLSTASEVDSELVEVVNAIRAAAEDAVRNRRNDTSGNTNQQTRYLSALDNQAPDNQGPNGRVGERLEEIFRITGTPQRTFVDPHEMPSIRRELGNPFVGLVLEGPSQIGKSSAVKRLLDRQTYYEISPWSSSKSRALYQQLQTLDALEKPLVVDDAHRLESSLFDGVVDIACGILQQPSPNGKVIIIGPPGIYERIPRHQRARFVCLRMGPQPPQVLDQLIDLGEKASNLFFRHRAEIVRQAHGSLRLAQEICLRLAQVQFGVAPAIVQEVVGHPDTVQASILDGLPYTEPLRRLVGQCGSPLAALAVLLELAVRPEGTTFAQVAAGNAALRDELQRLSLSLEAYVQKDLDLSEFLVVSARKIVVSDPRLGYWLAPRQLQDLARDLFLEARISDEMRLVIPSADTAVLPLRLAIAENPDPEDWLGGETYPLHLPKAYTLYDRCLKLYSSIPQIQFMAAKAGVGLGFWDNQHGAAPAWVSLLSLAAKQGKLRGLFEAILNDDISETAKATIHSIMETSPRSAGRSYSDPFHEALNRIVDAGNWDLAIRLVEDATERRDEIKVIHTEVLSRLRRKAAGDLDKAAERLLSIPQPEAATWALIGEVERLRHYASGDPEALRRSQTAFGHAFAADPSLWHGLSLLEVLPPSEHSAVLERLVALARPRWDLLRHESDVEELVALGEVAARANQSALVTQVRHRLERLDSSWGEALLTERLGLLAPKGGGDLAKGSGVVP